MSVRSRDYNTVATILLLLLLLLLLLQDYNCHCYYCCYNTATVTTSSTATPAHVVIVQNDNHIDFYYGDGCHDDDGNDNIVDFQIGAGLYAVGRPLQKRNDEDGQIGTIQSLPLERGALFNRFFGEPAHGPPHVAGGASGPIGGCRDESRTDNPDLDLRHVFDRNNRKTDLI